MDHEAVGYDFRTNQHFTLEQKPLRRADLDEFVDLYKAGNRDARVDGGEWRTSPPLSPSSRPSPLHWKQGATLRELDRYHNRRVHVRWCSCGSRCNRLVPARRWVAAEPGWRWRDTECLSELLAAFELIQSLRAAHHVEDRYSLDEQNEPLKHARAASLASLHGSPEELPITRGLTLRHIPYGAADEREAAHLQAAPKIGDPESESDEVRVIRGEIVDSLDRLRREILA